MKTRIINLTAHEARAFQRGATILVREVKPQPRPPAGVAIQLHSLDNGQFGFFDDHRDYACPFGQPGDLLIGREAWGLSGLGWAGDTTLGKVHYKATDNGEWKSYWGPWKSAARMPAEFARVRRIVSAVSLKRCQGLTEGEIEALKHDFREHNAKLWDANKFVWVTKVKEAT